MKTAPDGDANNSNNKNRKVEMVVVALIAIMYHCAYNKRPLLPLCKRRKGEGERGWEVEGAKGGGREIDGWDGRGRKKEIK